MSTDNYIFDGKGYESVPRALFLDNRLTPIERNAWVILKMLLETDGVTSLATYEQLQLYLTTSPISGKASTETVARALTMLRLTGWLSLTCKRRHEKGTVQGNVYVLHDEPLSIYERLHTDVEYLILLSNATTHSSKTIQKVAEYTLTELINDPHVAEKRLPTRLEVLTERLRQYRDEELSTTPNTEDSKNHLLRNNKGLYTDSEVRLKGSRGNRLRHRKDISSSKNKKILLQELRGNLKLPSRLKAVATVSMYDMGGAARNGIKQSQSLEQRKQVLQQATQQRYVEYTGGQTKYIPGTVNELTESSTAIEREFYDFYRTPRGQFTPQGVLPERTTQPTLSSFVKFMNFYPFNDIETISPRPMLFIAGENAHSIEFSEDAYRLAAEPKELYLVPNAGHVDLYDRVNLIPFAKITSFFQTSLK